MEMSSYEAVRPVLESMDRMSKDRRGLLSEETPIRKSYADPRLLDTGRRSHVVNRDSVGMDTTITSVSRDRLSTVSPSRISGATNFGTPQPAPSRKTVVVGAGLSSSTSHRSHSPPENHHYVYCHQCGISDSPMVHESVYGHFPKTAEAVKEHSERPGTSEQKWERSLRGSEPLKDSFNSSSKDIFDHRVSRTSPGKSQIRKSPTGGSTRYRSPKSGPRVIISPETLQHREAAPVNQGTTDMNGHPLYHVYSPSSTSAKGQLHFNSATPPKHTADLWRQSTAPISAAEVSLLKSSQSFVSQPRGVRKSEREPQLDLDGKTSQANLSDPLTPSLVIPHGGSPPPRAVSEVIPVVTESGQAYSGHHPHHKRTLSSLEKPLTFSESQPRVDTSLDQTSYPSHEAVVEADRVLQVYQRAPAVVKAEQYLPDLAAPSSEQAPRLPQSRGSEISKVPEPKSYLSHRESPASSEATPFSLQTSSPREDRSRVEMISTASQDDRPLPFQERPPTPTRSFATQSLDPLQVQHGVASIQAGDGDLVTPSKPTGTQSDDLSVEFLRSQIHDNVSSRATGTQAEALVPQKSVAIATEQEQTVYREQPAQTSPASSISSQQEIIEPTAVSVVSVAMETELSPMKTFSTQTVSQVQLQTVGVGSDAEAMVNFGQQVERTPTDSSLHGADITRTKPSALVTQEQQTSLNSTPLEKSIPIEGASLETPPEPPVIPKRLEESSRHFSEGEHFVYATESPRHDIGDQYLPHDQVPREHFREVEQQQLFRSRNQLASEEPRGFLDDEELLLSSPVSPLDSEPHATEFKSPAPQGSWSSTDTRKIDGSTGPREKIPTPPPAPLEPSSDEELEAELPEKTPEEVKFDAEEERRQIRRELEQQLREEQMAAAAKRQEDDEAERKSRQEELEDLKRRKSELARQVEAEQLKQKNMQTEREDESRKHHMQQEEDERLLLWTIQQEQLEERLNCSVEQGHTEHLPPVVNVEASTPPPQEDDRFASPSGEVGAVPKPTPPKASSRKGQPPPPPPPSALVSPESKAPASGADRTDMEGTEATDQNTPIEETSKSGESGADVSPESSDVEEPLPVASARKGRPPPPPPPPLPLPLPPQEETGRVDDIEEAVQSRRQTAEPQEGKQHPDDEKRAEESPRHPSLNSPVPKQNDTSSDRKTTPSKRPPPPKPPVRPDQSKQSASEGKSRPPPPRVRNETAREHLQLEDRRVDAEEEEKLAPPASVNESQSRVETPKETTPKVRPLTPSAQDPGASTPLSKPNDEKASPSLVKNTPKSRPVPAAGGKSSSRPLPASRPIPKSALSISESSTQPDPPSPIPLSSRTTTTATRSEPSQAGEESDPQQSRSQASPRPLPATAWRAEGDREQGNGTSATGDRTDEEIRMSPVDAAPGAMEARSNASPNRVVRRSPARNEPSSPPNKVSQTADNPGKGSEKITLALNEADQSRDLAVLSPPKPMASRTAGSPGPSGNSIEAPPSYFSLVEIYSDSCSEFLSSLSGSGPMPIYLSENIKKTLTYSVAFSKVAMDVLATLSPQFPSVQVSVDDALVSGTLYGDLLKATEREIEVLETKLKSQRLVLKTRQQCLPEEQDFSSQLHDWQRQGLESQGELMLQTLNDDLLEKEVELRPLLNRGRFNEMCLYLLQWLDSLTTTPGGGYIEKDIAMPLFGAIVMDLVAMLDKDPVELTRKGFSSVFLSLPKTVDEIREYVGFQALDDYRLAHGMDEDGYSLIRDGGGETVPIFSELFSEIRSQPMLRLIQHLKELNEKFASTPDVLQANPKYKRLSEAKQDALLEVVELAEQFRPLAAVFATKELQVRTIFHVYTNFQEVSGTQKLSFDHHFRDENERLRSEVVRNEQVLESRIKNFEMLLAEIELLRKLEHPPLYLSSSLVMRGEPLDNPVLNNIETPAKYKIPQARFKLVSVACSNSDKVGRTCTALFGNMLMHQNDEGVNGTKIQSNYSGQNSFDAEPFGQGNVGVSIVSEEQSREHAIAQRLAVRERVGKVVSAMSQLHAAQNKLSQRMRVIEDFLFPQKGLLVDASSGLPKPHYALNATAPVDQSPYLRASRPDERLPDHHALSFQSPHKDVDRFRSQSPRVFPPFALSAEELAHHAQDEEPATPAGRLMGHTPNLAAETPYSGTSAVSHQRFGTGASLKIGSGVSPPRSHRKQKNSSPYINQQRSQSPHQEGHRTVQLFGPDSQEMSLYQGHILLSHLRVLQHPGITVYLSATTDPRSGNLSGSFASAPEVLTTSAVVAATLTLSKDLSVWSVCPKTHTGGPSSKMDASTVSRANLEGSGAHRDIRIWVGSVAKLIEGGPIKLANRPDGQILKVCINSSAVGFDADEGQGDDESVSGSSLSQVSGPSPETLSPLSVIEMLFPSRQTYDDWAGLLELLVENKKELKFLREHLTQQTKPEQAHAFGGSIDRDPLYRRPVPPGAAVHPSSTTSNHNPAASHSPQSRYAGDYHYNSEGVAAKDDDFL